MDTAHSKKTFNAGEIIMRQGEHGDCAYIIEEGLVEIMIERQDGKTQIVGTRGPGTIIGEMAIVDEAPRTATVKALQNCKMLKINREDYAQRLQSTDPVIQMISQVILMRYRDMLARIEILGDPTTFPPPEIMERSVTEGSSVLESVRIANLFKEALEKGELELHYQPIVNLKDGEVSGFEALMRWTHPELGFISPAVFIPIAETSGLIIDASKWALKESCAALARIENALGLKNKLYMSVNFSSHDFAERDFVSNLQRELKNAKLLPHQLKVEITERLLITNPDTAKGTLKQCRDNGIGVSIDDFGTGYSSLSYLYHFPIDTLKVDQSFVRTMNGDEKSLELVKSIISLGKNMGMRIVAEGIEGEAEASLLKSIGCDSGQGYHFAKPMPESKVIETLSAWQPLAACAP